MAPRVSKDADVRRMELMETAMRLFTEVGYEQTSVQHITQEVGIAKGTFYHHFASKEDLLAQIASWQADAVLERVEEFSREMTGDPLREIGMMIGMFARWKFEEQPGLTRTYLKVMYRDENLALRTKLVTTYFEKLAPIFADVLAEAKEMGVCDIDDPETSADVMLAMMRGMSDHLAELLLAAEGQPDKLAEVLDHARAIEQAVERVLGIERGTLQLYDYEYVAGALRSLLSPEEDAG